MTQPIALVTGASKGIGLEIVRQLSQQNIKVLLAARSLEQAQQAAAQLVQDGLDVEAVQLEVTNSQHIQALVQHIQDTYGKLDILVNNAGVLLEKGNYDGDAFRDTLEVNTLAPFYLTEALLPLLLNSPAGRIVNQSSAIGSIYLQLNEPLVQQLAKPGYAVSKAALNMLTAYWSQQYIHTPLKVNSVHPGLVKTQMGGEEAPVSIEDGAKTAVHFATLPSDGPTGTFYHLDQQLPW
ncbi:SDR family NAD(P)-dependent oxidoreductase [Paenibacillus sp. WLX2291]|uniref:SDR family NAD(P)-dependent oxidoreductase n=1 Tax=Paenibacillus sp. WLX2291 TaxID=3296934 RepID=UPI00398409AB